VEPSGPVQACNGTALPLPLPIFEGLNCALNQILIFSHLSVFCMECRTPFETTCFFTVNAAGAIRYACKVIVNCFHLPDHNDLQVR